MASYQFKSFAPVKRTRRVWSGHVLTLDLGLPGPGRSAEIGGFGSCAWL